MDTQKLDASYSLVLNAINVDGGLRDRGNGRNRSDGESGARVLNNGAYQYRAVCSAALTDYGICIDHGYELAQSYYQRAQVYVALGNTEDQNSDLQASLSVAE